MKKKSKIFLFAFILGVFLAVSLKAGEDTAVIQPEPPEGEVVPPEELPPEEEPEEEEEEVSVEASVNLNPNRLNRNSRGRFITAYIEIAPPFNSSEIKRETVRITKINDKILSDPLNAYQHPYYIWDRDGDGIDDLMLKFSAADFKKELESYGEINVSIEGSLNSGETFIASGNIDTFAKPGEKIFNAKRRFKFRLKKHMPENSEIDKAVIWIKYKKARRANLWFKNLFNKWSSRHNYNKQYYYLPAKSGTGYEWDVTDKIKEDWRTLLENSEVVFDYDKNEVEGYPCLVVTYKKSQPSVEEDSAAKQDLVSAGPTFKIKEHKENIKLYYNESDLGGVPEQELKIYGWDEYSFQWKPAAACSVNLDENSITTPDDSYTQYKVMFFSGTSEPVTPEPDNVSAAGARLGQNYPNPFNPATTINYSIPADAHVTMKLFNVRGQLVATVIDEFKYAGDHSVYFDGGEKLSRGIYYYQLKAGDFVATKRMVVLR